MGNISQEKRDANDRAHQELHGKGYRTFFEVIDAILKTAEERAFDRWKESVSVDSMRSALEFHHDILVPPIKKTGRKLTRSGRGSDRHLRTMFPERMVRSVLRSFIRAQAYDFPELLKDIDTTAWESRVLAELGYSGKDHE